MPENIRITMRRTIDHRLIWFRIEHTDGYALEVKARPDTTAAEMELARRGAMATLGASHE